MSIVHLVCWKYKAETEPSLRAEHIEKLRALKAVIPEIVEFEVGSDILHLDRSFDSGLYSRFNDRAGLESYSLHPAHRIVASMGKEISEHVVSVDFVSDDRHRQR